SDSVLRRMARRCKTEEFSEIVSDLRAAIPHFNITTDIIVGFPGETEQEWRESFGFIENTGFGHIHIFAYSRREGTKAATLPNQIPETVKKQRSRELHLLADKMKRQFQEENLGQTIPILWESQTEFLDNGKHRIFGYTPNYLRVGCEVDEPEAIENRIIDAKLMATDNNHVVATLV
ncbi:MAG TPA: tRNA (N(6)-L-threonylcarbamoyladenosine(37)-C(2))-methylthiotransferase MtaB, partial [Methylococcaceae bacterium]|nr:tRNA (N(6)-L-threonylcarbamoyladenosine(37)-C(2))-methylthiotransferase MtaB [Methylococcaceae bacterium]